jgi:hypothetical protein
LDVDAGPPAGWKGDLCRKRDRGQQSRGDVIVSHPGQIIRTDPKSDSTDFEPRFLTEVKFDRSDFPSLPCTEVYSSGTVDKWLRELLARGIALLDLAWH